MISVHVESIFINAATHEQMVKLVDGDGSVNFAFQVEAAKGDALKEELQGRPQSLTDELLKIYSELSSVEISDVSGDDFFARINDTLTPVIDAVLAATRLKIPIYVTDEVVQKAAVLPPRHPRE